MQPPKNAQSGRAAASNCHPAARDTAGGIFRADELYQRLEQETGRSAAPPRQLSKDTGTSRDCGQGGGCTRERRSCRPVLAFQGLGQRPHSGPVDRDPLMKRLNRCAVGGASRRPLGRSKQLMGIMRTGRAGGVPRVRLSDHEINAPLERSDGIGKVRARSCSVSFDDGPGAVETFRTRGLSLPHLRPMPLLGIDIPRSRSPFSGSFCTAPASMRLLETQ